MVLKYSIAFDLARRSGGPLPLSTREVWSSVVELLHKTLRVADRLPDREAMQQLIDCDRSDLAGAADLDVRWARDAEDPTNPTWAVTIQHPGTRDERLLWGVDVSARRTAGRPRVGVRMWVEALDRIRQPLTAPASRPGLVRHLMQRWLTTSNGLELRDRFAAAKALRQIRNLLTDPNRHLPILLLGPAAVCGWGAGRPRLHRHLIALERQTGGAAVLAVLPDTRAFRAFNAGLDACLQLPDTEQFAVYWPLERGMRREDIAARCREVANIPSAEEVDAVVTRVATRLAECLVIEDPGRIATVDALRARQNRLDDQRRSSAQTDLAGLRNDYDELVAEHERIEARLDEVTRERDDLSQEIRKLKILLFETNREQDEAVAPSIDWSDWEVADMAVAMAICQASPWLRDRVVFSDAARKGAKSPYAEPRRALAAIHFLGGEFLERIRQGTKGDLVEFSAHHGFEVAMLETGVTRNNETWMRERDVIVGGNHFRCEPHLKLKTGAAKDSPHLRLSIHFAIDRSGPAPRIVLGHVGRHLTTASSKNW